MYGKTLVHDLGGDLSGNTKLLFIKLVTVRTCPAQQAVKCGVLKHVWQ